MGIKGLQTLFQIYKPFLTRERFIDFEFKPLSFVKRQAKEIINRIDRYSSLQLTDFHLH